ncbi:MAG: ABC transporter permease subunit [bacterium]
MKDILQIIWINIKNKKSLLLILVAINVFLILTYALIWPSLASQMKALNELMATLPPAFLKGFNIESQLNGNFESMLVTKQFGSTLPILLVILTTSLGGDSIASEIDKGTIQMYLTLPISRTKYFVSRYLSGALIVLLFSIFSVLIAVPISWIFNLDVTVSHYLVYTISTFLLGLTFFSISYLVSAISSVTNRVVIVSILVFLVSYVINVISGLSDKLVDLKYFSLIYYFGPSETIVNYSIPVFIGISIICFVLGLKLFKRRDISIR